MESKPAKKILAFMLAAALIFGGVVAAPPQTAFAAMPTQYDTAIGKPYDGVDFDALMASGGGIYYGTYKHATSLDSSYGDRGEATLDTNFTPILWRVMGEEASDGLITLLSEYILDSQQFHNAINLGDNYYNASEIRKWLNGTFINSFKASEQDGMAETNVVTGMYDYTSGAEQTGTYKAGDNHTYTADLPWTATGDKVYLPWGKASDHSVYWTAGNDVNEGKLGDNIGTLKNGTTPVSWWLRSPHSGNSNLQLYVYRTGGTDNASYPNQYYAIRPAFKLNPKSVIFTSEIKSGANIAKGETPADGTNYIATSPSITQSYKLTVVDNSSGNTLNGVPTTAQTVDTGVDYELIGLAPSQTGPNYTINYKIVGDGTGGREIKGYGFVAAQASTDLTLDISSLANGNYDVYVWLQKNNDINSNEASAVKHFTLDTAAPTISSVTPSGTGADTNGNITVTFNESMDTSVGTVSLSGGIGPLTGTWSTATHTNDTFTAAYTGLEWNTPYTITIAGFQDVVGNAIDPDPDTNHAFTTKAQPDGPDVSPTTLNLDLNGNATGTLSIFLGQSGNRAATAAVAVDSGYTGDISVSPFSLNADGAVTVTGLNVVSGAGITVEFSGGNLASPTSIPVTVNVADSTPPTPPTPPNVPPPPPSNWNNSTALAAIIADHSSVTAMRDGGSIRLAAVLKAHTSVLYVVPTGVTLQWQYYDEASGKWLDIDGATEPTYTYTGPATRFRLVVKSGNKAFMSVAVEGSIIN